jgi:hypothetical protein
MTIIATVLGVSRAAVSEIMSAFMNHGKTTSAKRKQWAHININRKRLSFIEKDCFEKSQNYCSTGDSRTEYSS